MYLLECVFMLNHCMCTYVGSNPCRKLSLLGFAHPVEGSLFQVQGLFEKTALIRGHVRRKSSCGFGIVILYNMYYKLYILIYVELRVIY